MLDIRYEQSPQSKIYVCIYSCLPARFLQACRGGRNEAVPLEIEQLERK